MGIGKLRWNFSLARGYGRGIAEETPRKRGR
jgi:hypothetical protein